MTLRLHHDGDAPDPPEQKVTTQPVGVFANTEGYVAPPLDILETTLIMCVLQELLECAGVPHCDNRDQLEQKASRMAEAHARSHHALNLAGGAGTLFKLRDRFLALTAAAGWELPTE